MKERKKGAKAVCDGWKEKEGRKEGTEGGSVVPLCLCFTYKSGSNMTMLCTYVAQIVQ